VVAADEKVVLREEGVTLERLEQVGFTLARVLKSGDVVLLYGPLGAGKTALVRAMARALDVTDPVRSPSFTIANIYSGKMTIQHLDLYRLDEICEDDALALEEYVQQEDAVTLIEWPQAGLERLGEAARIVTLDHRSIDERFLELSAGNADAAARWSEAESVHG
jgi:tRNA threonylcarbamoyladenosine biosynthesis protein TsaE